MIWRKVKESNPRDVFARPGFQDQLRATARHLPNLAGTPGFEPRISGLESDGLPLAYAQEFLVHVVGLAPTKDNQVRLIYGQVLCCSATHARSI